jgi:hypothetical protein
MATKAKAGLSGTIRKEPVPKLTRQGNGKRSKPSHGRKLRKGQLDEQHAPSKASGVPWQG